MYILVDAVVSHLPASAGVVRDVGLISVLGRSPGVGNGNPLQYSCPENPTDRGAWRATVHGVAKSQTRLSDFHICFLLISNAFSISCICALLGGEDLLEKEMATHSSILAQKIPWMEEPGRLQSMELQRVGHD